MANGVRYQSNLQTVHCVVGIDVRWCVLGCESQLGVVYLLESTNVPAVRCGVVWCGAVWCDAVVQYSGSMRCGAVVQCGVVV